MHVVACIQLQTDSEPCHVCGWRPRGVVPCKHTTLWHGCGNPHTLCTLCLSLCITVFLCSLCFLFFLKSRFYCPVLLNLTVPSLLPLYPSVHFSLKLIISAHFELANVCQNTTEPCFHFAIWTQSHVGVFYPFSMYLIQFPYKFKYFFSALYKTWPHI